MSDRPPIPLPLLLAIRKARRLLTDVCPTFAQSECEAARAILAAVYPMPDSLLPDACRAAERWFSKDFSEGNESVPLKQLRAAIAAAGQQAELHPSPDTSLIERLQSEIIDKTGSDEEYGWNSGLLMAMTILCQHAGGQPPGNPEQFKCPYCKMGLKGDCGFYCDTPQASESSVDEAALREKLVDAYGRVPVNSGYRDLREFRLDKIMEVLRPFLRTTEPVSIAQIEPNVQKWWFVHSNDVPDLIKAVLDAAGVKYVD